VSDFLDVALSILALVLSLALIVYAGVHVEEYLVRRALRRGHRDDLDGGVS